MGGGAEDVERVRDPDEPVVVVEDALDTSTTAVRLLPSRNTGGVRGWTLYPVRFTVPVPLSEPDFEPDPEAVVPLYPWSFHE